MNKSIAYWLVLITVRHNSANMQLIFGLAPEGGSQANPAAPGKFYFVAARGKVAL